ncbi:MAG TPA: hypothetical protein VLA82_10455 [Actinomycetota bacterium]|nr:hypothetical protein [Actinomycetota bacterium]
MRTVMVLGAALVLMLLAFPLVSVGTTGDADALWWIGAALLVVGGVIPPLTRYVIRDD